MSDTKPSTGWLSIVAQAAAERHSKVGKLACACGYPVWTEGHLALMVAGVIEREIRAENESEEFV